MFYNASEITNTLSTKGISQNSITSIPSFNSFDSNLFSLLPQNVLSYDASGNIQILNPSVIKEFLDNAVAKILPEISTSATSYLNSLKGMNFIQADSFQAFTDLGSTDNVLLKGSEDFSRNVSVQAIDTLANNNYYTQLGALNNAVDNSYPSLTPKGVKDLDNPSVYDTKKDSIVNTASSNLKDTSLKMSTEEYKNAGFNNSAQQKLQQLSSSQYSGNNEKGYSLYVRRTVYWAYGPGTDIDSAALRSSTGRQLQQGTSVAVDPSVIPYLSRIEFADIGTRYATDTGGAVKSRKASGGNEPVVDVFFLTKEDALKFANSTPEYVTIKVFPPATQYKYAANSSPTYGTA